MTGIILTTLATFAIGGVVLVAIRTERKLTWTTATLLGTVLTAIALLLLADVPSLIHYWIDAEHQALGARLPGFLGSWMDGDQYFILRDIAANTVQGIFFVILTAAAYFWGEKHRKEGRFKS